MYEALISYLGIEDLAQLAEKRISETGNPDYVFHELKGIIEGEFRVYSRWLLQIVVIHLGYKCYNSLICETSTT